MIAGLPDHVHNAARIRYPMVRVDWMRKGHQSDTSQRGDNRFVRVSGMKRWICSIRNWSGCKNLRAERATDGERLAIYRHVP